MGADCYLFRGYGVSLKVDSSSHLSLPSFAALFRRAAVAYPPTRRSPTCVQALRSFLSESPSREFRLKSAKTLKRCDVPRGMEAHNAVWNLWIDGAIHAAVMGRCLHERGSCSDVSISFGTRRCCCVYSRVRAVSAFTPCTFYARHGRVEEASTHSLRAKRTPLICPFSS